MYQRIGRIFCANSPRSYRSSGGARTCRIAQSRAKPPVFPTAAQRDWQTSDVVHSTRNWHIPKLPLGESVQSLELDSSRFHSTRTAVACPSLDDYQTKR